MSKSATVFSSEQEAAINDRSRELVVSAAAGSGKTGVLVERIVRRLLGISTEGRIPGPATQLHRLLVVTFTRKAALEMRARLGARLQQAVEDSSTPDAMREDAWRQLTLLPTARIGTIHSFCAALIHQYGAAAGMSQRRHLDQQEAARLRHDIANGLLDASLDGTDHTVTELALAWGGPDGVGLEDLSSGNRDQGLRPLVLELSAFQNSLVDAQRWLASFAPLQLDPHHFQPTEPRIAALLSEFNGWCLQSARVAREQAALLCGDEGDVPHCQLLRHRAVLLEAACNASEWNDIGERLVQLFARLDGTGESPRLPRSPQAASGTVHGISAESHWRQRIDVERIRFKRAAQQWLDFFGCPWELIAEQENGVSQQLTTLWRLALEFNQRYSAYKLDHGICDFSDLERDALHLLAARDDVGGLVYGDDGLPLPSAIALEQRLLLDEVLIDEYQDTNELQDAILSLVTPEAPLGGRGYRRFVVGDLKQSIYGFRLADPQLFRALCDRLDAGPPESVGHLRLNRNYRSRAKIVNAINHVFEGLLTADLGGEEYADASLSYGADYPLSDAEAAVGARLTVVLKEGKGRGNAACASAEPTDSDDSSTASEETEDVSSAEMQYAHVARLICEIHDSGKTVYDQSRGRSRPVEWRDFAILLRSTTGIDLLSKALARAGIPFAAETRVSLYDQVELRDILSLLQVINDPLQDIPLAAVLHGPAFKLSASDLLAIAHASSPARADLRRDEPFTAPEPLSLWHRLAKRSTWGDLFAERLRHIASQLSCWRNAIQQDGLPAVIWQLYHEANLLVAAAAQPGGAQRYANLLTFHDIARQFCAVQRQGLPFFLETIRLEQRANSQLREAPQAQVDNNCVQVMTIHKAKGLEFPIVFISDLQRHFNMLDLRADAVWHRRGGLGGMHFDLRDRPLRRSTTIGHRQVCSLKRKALLEEELRVLYVGLTRARERLELVCTVSEADLDEIGLRETPPLDANSPWQWLCRQLNHEIAAARTGEENETSPWQVAIHHHQVQEVPDQRHIPELSLSTVANLESALVRITTNYGGSVVPAPWKVTVTGINEGSPTINVEEPDEALQEFFRQAPPIDSPFVISPHLPQASSQNRAARRQGILVHGICQKLVETGRFTTECSATDVQSALQSFLPVLGETDKHEVHWPEPESFAAAVVDLAVKLRLDECRLLTEVTLAAAMTREEIACVAIDSLRQIDAQAMIMVQGKADLLVQHPDGSATVVDFKTDRHATATVLRERYAGQLELYVELARRALKPASIRWAIFGFDGAGLVEPV